MGWSRQQQGAAELVFLVVKEWWPHCKAVNKVVQQFSPPPSGALPVPRASGDPRGVRGSRCL